MKKYKGQPINGRSIDFRDIQGFVFGSGCFKEKYASNASNCMTIIGQEKSGKEKSQQDKAGREGGKEKVGQVDLVFFSVVL